MHETLSTHKRGSRHLTKKQLTLSARQVSDVEEWEMLTCGFFKKHFTIVCSTFSDGIFKIFEIESRMAMI